MSIEQVIQSIDEQISKRSRRGQSLTAPDQEKQRPEEAARER